MTDLRAKNSKGQFVSKRFDTKIGTIEKQYGVKLDVRADTKLGNYLKSKGYTSLSKMLKR